MNKLKYLLIIFFFLSCASRKGSSNYNTSNFYSSDIHTQIKVFHSSEDSSIFYIKLRSSDFIRKTDMNVFGIKLRINIDLKNNDANNLGNYTQMLLWPMGERDQKDTIIAIKLPIGLSTNKIIYLNLFDVHKGLGTSIPYQIQKLKAGGAQFYEARNAEGKIIFENFVRIGAEISVTGMNADKPLQVFYFNRRYFNSGPPFVELKNELIDFNPDSSFNVANGERLKLEKKGIYFFSDLKNPQAGITIAVFEEDFPKVQKTNQLIEPLVYICERKEYVEMREAIDRIILFDNFWLNAAGSNKERAKLLIRKYYGRVEYANQNLSTYKEGWKTDKGMIYILFGEPEAVYLDEQTEIWDYKNLMNIGTVRFKFNLGKNVFSERDYVLERDVLYQIPWYQAVEAWRQGIIRK